MSLSEDVVEGTLNPDGSLELDAKPKVTPGRVTVIVRQTPPPLPPSENWFALLQRIRARRETEGFLFMGEEETQRHLDWLREGDQVDELLREVKER